MFWENCIQRNRKIRRKIIWREIQVHEQKEWDFEYVHLKTGEKRWFHNIEWAVR